MKPEETSKFLKDNKYKILISQDEIKKKVRELGKKISEDYHGKCPILVGVLNGGFIFCADLFREIDIDCEVDFIKISSYGEAMETSGRVKLLKDIDAHLQGRHVLLVEDIVDSGYSVQYLRKKLEETYPETLKFVSLLVKEGNQRVPYEIDYAGFRIPNRFVVGYGLDFAQKYRNLPHIYLMD
ncbi:hypoxanthine phosphoribosyltransferase [candidate division KSB1 bacterium]|nr:hypoxanthine phosphoribosyltransferase [candidate division KSB1 bacterium]